MNRRRFLKYAGVIAAVVGTSAIGLDYLLSPRSTKTTQPETSKLTTLMSSIATANSTKTTDLQLRFFHDYNGDGTQQSDEPLLKDLTIEMLGMGNGYKTRVSADSDGKYWAREVAVGVKYTLVFDDPKFNYASLNNGDFVRVSDYSFLIDSNEPTLAVGLMEGFMTLPVSKATSFTWDRYWDWDPDLNHFLWWNGQSGSNQVNDYPNGFNHASIDYGMDEGQPILASMPGIVMWTTNFSSRREVQSVFLGHDYGFVTSYDHLSKSVVNVGDSVARGQKIAESGSTGDIGYPHLDSTLRIQRGRVTLDPFHPVFPVNQAHSGYYEILATSVGGHWVPVPSETNPAIPNYWTAYNKPQFAATKS